MRPYIEIDGRQHPLAWNTHFFEVPQGKHHVRCFIRNFLGFDSPPSKVDLDVLEDKVTKISYDMPIFLWSYLMNWVTVVGTEAQAK